MKSPTLKIALAATVVVFALAGANLPASATTTCSLSAQPSPGWVGADITISGTGFAPSTEIGILNFGGIAVGTPTTNASGAFSIGYSIPGDFPVGTTNLFASDGFCEDNPSYQVLASQPTTTTTAPPATTTVPPATTTTIAPVGTTTVPAGATTTTLTATTSPGDASTTTTLSDIADSETTGDTIPGWMWFLVGGLGLAVALLAGVMIGRRGGSSGPDVE